MSYMQDSIMEVLWGHFIFTIDYIRDFMIVAFMRGWKNVIHSYILQFSSEL